MAPQRSRGCLRCRQRRVKCDQAKPSCQRCLLRNEVCAGYREEADLIFQYETEKVISRSRLTAPSATLSSSSTASSPYSSSTRRRARSQSSSAPRSRLDSESPPASLIPPSEARSSTDLAHKLDGLSLLDEQAAAGFLDKYVIYPCNESSSPGFLEHLPCLFADDVNVDGRCALRWAVQAAGFADLSRNENNAGPKQRSEAIAAKAFQCYGNALTALGKSLSEKGKTPDDYDLMTMVVLDIFETLFIPDETQPGSHAQGMAHILRLRGHNQFHDPRGWSLFRLAHHRLQKQQLAKDLHLLPEPQAVPASHAANDSFSHLESDVSDITRVCRQATEILKNLASGIESQEELVSLVLQIHQLDYECTTWRQRPEWAFKTLFRSEVSGAETLQQPLPDRIQIHRDIWMVYEWNYHRTARIIMHQRLLKCLELAVSRQPRETPAGGLLTQRETSTLTIQNLADEVLATVPQSFGDINQLGQCTNVQSSQSHSQAIGAYLLLWPIKIIKGAESKATAPQRQAAQNIFERIRETTGMKRTLGDLSII